MRQVMRAPGRRKARHGIHLGAVLCLAFLLVPANLHATTQVAIDARRTWLLQHGSEDGSWRSLRDPAGIRSTAQALRALGDATLAGRGTASSPQLPY